MRVDVNEFIDLVPSPTPPNPLPPVELLCSRKYATERTYVHTSIRTCVKSINVTHTLSQRAYTHTLSRCAQMQTQK